MAADYCPLHEILAGRMEDLEKTQKARKCLDLERRIIHLETSDSAQWNDINKLKVIVYTGAGASAFVGSIVGALIAALLRGRF